MSPKKPEPRERLRYDAILKELFQREHPQLLSRLTGGKAVKQTLNVEFAVIKEWRADLLFELVDGSLFLLEFQSTNSTDMAHRVGIYTLAASLKFKRPVHAAVLYTGARKMQMVQQFNAGAASVKYDLVDIRDIEASVLLRGRPGDWVLALLGHGGKDRLREILAKLVKLKGSQRDRLLTQTMVLAGLRRIQEEVKMEVNQMSEYVNLKTHPFLSGILAKERAESFKRGSTALLGSQLRQKFGALPGWAKQRLETATQPQIKLWSRKVLTASTLEGVIRRGKAGLPS